jgi:hypothetical protein
MHNPIKDIAGLVKSKITKRLVNRSVTSNLVTKIGPEGIIGSKNQGIYYKRVRGMLDAGKPQDAIKYARSEEIKVRNQK